MNAAGSEDSTSRAVPQSMSAPGEQSIHSKASSRRLRLLAVGATLLLVLIAGAVLAFLFKSPSKVDQVVILTVPSGAEITFDSKSLGPSPIKLEAVPVGLHKVTVSKEGYESLVDDEITVTQSGTFPYKLKKTGEPTGLTSEERIKDYTARAKEAFAREDYCAPYEYSALYFANQIKTQDESNQFADEMIETIRRTLYQRAQAAAARGDLAQAQEHYTALLENYPREEEARTAAVKLAAQLAAKRGEVRDFVRKAEESLRSGDYDGARNYSKQALARDHHNAEATAVLVKLKDKLEAAVNDADLKGDFGSMLRILDQEARFFPEDKQVRARMRNVEARRESDARGVLDPAARRVRGLERYSRGEFTEAISDLKYALDNGAKAGPDVYFAMGRSNHKLHQLDLAAYYYLRVGDSAPDAHHSALAALGDIAMERGDRQAALARYKEAIALGGSTLYPVAELEEKVARIEVRRQQEKGPEAGPVSVKAKHLHGGLLKGSCAGTLAVNSTGVRFDGGEHTFASNLVAVGVTVARGEMTVKFQDKTEKFSLAPTDAGRFKDALSGLQAATTQKNN